MRHIYSLGTVFTAFGILFLHSVETHGGASPPHPVANLAHQKVLQSLDLSPAIFVENKGQWDTDVRYGFDGKGTRVSFTDSGPVFQILRSTGEDGEVSRKVFSARFVGADKVPPVGLEQSTSKTNYYIGKDPSKWRTGVSSFRKMAYYGLYDGVDLYTWGKRSGLKYEFHVAPGKSWEDIVIRYDGIEGLSVDGKGALHVKTALGEMVDDAPVAYQETKDGRREIPVRFRLVAKDSYAFEITGLVDSSLELVIDPDLCWATCLGGTDDDFARAIALDAYGNTWVTGYTHSSDFPTLGGFDASLDGNRDVFVARFTPSGDLAWASYLGGSGDDLGHRIAIDALGNVWLTGYSSSSDFPTPGGFDALLGGPRDAFVARITPSGTLAWASYLGGSGSDYGYGIAVDKTGNVWVFGLTYSSDFPTPKGFGTSRSGASDAFVARITAQGALAWATYLGGTGDEFGQAIALDARGNAWVVGSTDSPDFPTPGGFGTSPGGASDAFVARITSQGALAWATYLAGSDVDSALAIAVDDRGNALVTGWTTSLDFPAQGGFDTSQGGVSDAFVAKITASGSLAWATYLGGAGDDTGYGIAVDGNGNAWVTGYTQSSDFPVVGVATSLSGTTDAFLAKITASGSLTCATYLGGGDEDYGRAVVLNGAGGPSISGYTLSSDFPTPGGSSGPLNDAYDAFVAVFSGGFTCTAPLDAVVFTPSYVPLFQFIIDPDVKSPFIAFSNSPDFPKKPVRDSEGQLEKTVRFPVRPGSTLWMPAPGQWKAVKQLVFPGAPLYWRLEGRIGARTSVYGRPWSFSFDCGHITNIHVNPSHAVDLDEAIWPDTPPAFLCTNATVGMKYFCVDVSTSDSILLSDKKATVTFGGRIQSQASYECTAADWKKMRKLASASAGILYWRVRATDLDKVLTCVSSPRKLIVDGGEWTVSDLDLSAAPGTVNWTCSAHGHGIVKFCLQFSTRGDFPAKGGLTIKAPAASIAALSYTLSEKEVAGLRKLATKHGVSFLYYRVRGEDADKAFLAYSDAKTVDIP